jgi:Uma2 family endonuclease
MSSTKTLMTADELLQMPKDGFRYELIQGELKKMSPAGSLHGSSAMNFAAFLTIYILKHNLGVVFAAETGFKIAVNPDTVIAPDFAFVRKENIPATGVPKGYWLGAPDLAVEVISPSDTKKEIQEKVEQWLTAGAKMVVLIYPSKKTLVVYRSLTSITTLKENDIFSGDDVIDGLSCKVSDIFI